MFGDAKAQRELLATTTRLAEELEALRQRCAGLEAQLQALDPDGVRGRQAELAATVQAQQLDLEKLRVDNVALAERLDEQSRQAQAASTALFQRLEQLRMSIRTTSPS